MPNRSLEVPHRRPLLARLREMPHLAEIVPRLEPAALHQIIRVCGLEDCAEIVALASPAQLTRVFDYDLWTSARAGVEEQFDPIRFGVWLEVLVETGLERASATLKALDFDFVASAMHQQIVVLDPWTARSPQWADVDVTYALSGYTVIPRRQDAWDAVLAILVELDADDPEFLLRLLQACCRQSIDHVDDSGHEGQLFQVQLAAARTASDVAFARERRREAQGFVTPVQATAFLTSSRHLRLAAPQPAWDPSTVEYFRRFEMHESDDERPVRQEGNQTTATPAAEVQRALADVMSALHDEAASTGSRPQLSGRNADDRLGRIRTWLSALEARNPRAGATTVAQLAYLTNVLVAGCSFDSRRFTPAEASDAVWATCNLGLERWPQSWPAPDDVITVFRVGWHVLYVDVCAHVTERLIAVLADLTTEDHLIRTELRSLRNGLQRALRAGTPWTMKDDLEVLASFDLPTWSMLARLLDRCPVVPRPEPTLPEGAPRLRVSAAFEFVADDAQIRWVRTFAGTLLSRLVE